MSENEKKFESETLSKEDQEKISLYWENTQRLAMMGQHFLLFIVRCRILKVEPKIILKLFKDGGLTNEEYKDVPILRLTEWIESPTEENFLALSKALNVDIDEIAKEQLDKISKQDILEKAKKDSEKC